MTKLELFFGGDIGAQGGFSEDDWRRFLAEDVTPRFPDGFSVVDAHGQWRNAAGTIIAEQSRDLIVIVPNGSSESAKVASIRDAYKMRFRQESVLFVQSEVCAGF